MTHAIVVPSTVIDDRVKTNCFQWHAGAHGVARLRRNITIPCCAPVILDSRLGNQQRSAIARIGLDQDPAKRLVERVADVDRLTAVDPLVVEVIIDADNVEIALVPPICGQIRPEIRSHP